MAKLSLLIFAMFIIGLGCVMGDVQLHDKANSDSVSSASADHSSSAENDDDSASDSKSNENGKGNQAQPAAGGVKKPCKNCKKCKKIAGTIKKLFNPQSNLLSHPAFKPLLDDDDVKEFLGKKRTGPKCKKPNQVYRNPGPVCPQTCQYLKDACRSERPKKAGCYCKTGFVRNAYNECVAGKAYCKRCPRNEYYAPRGSPCQTTCANLGKPCNVSPLLQGARIAGCYCKDGFARLKNKKCVPVRSCPGKFFKHFYI